MGQFLLAILAQPNAGGTDVISYQWQSSLNGSDWLNIDGETNLNCNPNTFSNNLFWTKKLKYFRRFNCIWLLF